jgi:glycosyltransferase involved in cell wall biosynthesis
LVFLKTGPGVDAPLDERVSVILLASEPWGWIGRLKAYIKLLKDSGGRRQVGSISMCLSADLLNLFCRNHSVICASVRGNLPQNYYHDYGWFGTFLAVGHLLALRRLDHVVAMTNAMADQIYTRIGLRPQVIGNFVDEAVLEPYRRIEPSLSGQLRFVFVGSLSARKQPDLVITAMNQLRDSDAHLDVIGDGPQRAALGRLVVSMGLESRVRLHGHVAYPHMIVASADVFVLPSRSEGVSRAALEALYLGVPCVLRDVDGNAELLSTPGAGALFAYDEDLLGTMLQVAKSTRMRTAKISLLPRAFQQRIAASQYLALLERP